MRVDQNGRLTPVNTGSAYVSLTVDGVQAKTKVTVCPFITDFTLPDKLFALVNDYSNIPLSVEPAGAICKFTVEAENENYAYGYVWEEYNYLALWGSAIGNTTITVTDEYTGIKKSVPVRVARNITSASIETKTVKIRIGQRASLKAKVVLGQEQFENQLVEWVIDNGNINCVSLDSFTGEIEGLAPGETKINLLSLRGDILDTCTVIVTGSTFSLPSGLTQVENEAFRGIDADIIIIPNGVKSIGAYAFADSKAFCVTIHIPASVSKIDPNAFAGCKKVLIYGKEGSAAETFANEHENCTFVEDW